MSRVQISNARRISFTALAVVSFWVLAIRGYWVTSDLWDGSSGYHGEPGRWVEITSTLHDPASSLCLTVRQDLVQVLGPQHLACEGLC